VNNLVVFPAVPAVPGGDDAPGAPLPGKPDDLCTVTGKARGASIGKGRRKGCMTAGCRERDRPIPARATGQPSRHVPAVDEPQGSDCLRPLFPGPGKRDKGILAGVPGYSMDAFLRGPVPAGWETMQPSGGQASPNR